MRAIATATARIPAAATRRTARRRIWDFGACGMCEVYVSPMPSFGGCERQRVEGEFVTGFFHSLALAATRRRWLQNKKARGTCPGLERLTLTNPPPAPSRVDQSTRDRRRNVTAVRILRSA